MSANFVHEPELEFGDNGRHIDIRFGLMNYGPTDYASTLAPKRIHVGIVGTNETIYGVEHWFDKCRDEIAEKQSRYPYLFPKFPGFETTFRASIIVDTQLQRPIPQQEFDRLTLIPNRTEALNVACQLFVNELKYLVENNPTLSVLVCAMPTSVVDIIEHENIVDTKESKQTRGMNRQSVRDYFHDLLKAQAMVLKKPTQIIRPETYDESKKRRQKGHRDRTRELQDEATRAWNLLTALYYKAGGKPWRIARDPYQLTSCYIGISFYRTTDQSRLLTSVAQVFNELGDGVIVRGGAAQISKDDRRAHLLTNDAFELLSNALETYRMEHHTLPARVVLHKSSGYNPEEIEGFTQAIREHHIDLFDFISFGDTAVRLFRHGENPPLRGTLLSLGSQSHILYTRGSVDFFSVYPGLYVPDPLEFRCENVGQTPQFLANEILALTKMNWNNTQFDGRLPITLRAAHEVGSILKYLQDNDTVEARYSFYM